MLQADLAPLRCRKLQGMQYGGHGTMHASRNEPYGLTFNFTEFAMLPPERVDQLKAGK